MQKLISPGQNRFQLGGSEARAVLKISEKNLLVHCNENPIYVFLFWELRGLSPNVSVSDLYISRIGPHISCSRIGRSIMGIYKSLSDT
jgi:hypothetical protein